MDTTVDGLQIEIVASSDDAERKLSELCNTLDRLKNSIKGIGISGLRKQFSDFNTSLNAMAETSHKLEKLTKGLGDLSRAGNFKMSSSIANQVTKLGTAAQSLNNADFGKLGELADAITPLTTMSKSNLSSALTPIRKLPETFQALNSVDMTAFRSKIDELTVSLKPLADEMQKVANGFSAFPTKIQKLLDSTNRVPKANNAIAKSYVNIAAKIGMVYVAARQVGNTIASWIGKSNDYVENLNLFSVSMGEFATEAHSYAQTVGNLMGIDPGEWMRNQGIFMTLATGFGVVNDRAYTMSQNLTQLGYDLSSFFNVTYEDAMTKLQSGISGELEPLRRLGYDLSNAKLEAVALSLGIDKSVSSMTQAEKAELRYYAIMTQVTTVQGDMARTLEAPANQLRVLRAQLEQTARALGNIFIPALNAVLPYAIAVVQVIRHAADAIASLFGFEKKTVAGSNMGSIASGAEDISNAFDNATGSAKQLKNAMLGIDELNVINPDIGAGANSGIGAGGFNFDLPTYDFIKALSESRVGEIVKDMKEWLGLTGEITSWADLFDTKLGKILIVVGSIGAGFGLWKISENLWSGMNFVQSLTKSNIGVALSGAISSALMKAFGGTSFGWLTSVFGAKVTGALSAAGSVIAAHPAITAIVSLVAITLASAFIDYDFTEIGKKLGEAIGKGCRAAYGWITDVVDWLTDGLEKAFDWVAENINLDSIWNIFNPNWWGENIIPAMVEVGWYILDGIAAGIWEGWSNFLLNIGEFVQGCIDGFNEAFGINSPAEKMKPTGRFIMGGIRVGLSEGWNDIQSWWKGLSLPQLYFKTPHFTWSTRAATGTIKKVMDFLNIPARIPSLSVSWYKDGGYPAVGELFVAREAGPEMVGKMGNRTTVANNEQIVEGISEGVYAAVLAAMRQSEGNGGQAVNVYLDGRQITAAVEKRQHERGASIMRNGVYAY